MTQSVGYREHEDEEDEEAEHNHDDRERVHLDVGRLWVAGRASDGHDGRLSDCDTDEVIRAVESAPKKEKNNKKGGVDDLFEVRRLFRLQECSSEA